MIKNTSLSYNKWKEKLIDNNLIKSLSQKKIISELFAKLLIARGVNEENYDHYLKPTIDYDIPNPFELKDMEKGITRCVEALKNNEKIGIIADYDVDGSTSVSILVKFLNNFTKNIIYRIPNRLSEGYGPNIRLMKEMLRENVKLLTPLIKCEKNNENSENIELFSKQFVSNIINNAIENYEKNITILFIGNLNDRRTKY